jgi:membrane-bound lytic murein transglycosylase D
MKFKLLIIAIFTPLLLLGALTFDTNHQKEIEVLRSFDVDSSFLNDPVLLNMVEAIKLKSDDESFFKAMDDAYLFIPMIKSIMAEYNVPAELLFLAMAESNFYSGAKSKKSASGLWQFMAPTGKLYGLKIDQYVDERKDFLKSTRAAMEYLTKLHKIFGKWYLAAIAYNCGPGKLERTIKAVGTDNLNVLLDDDKKYLPLESRLYIRKVMALALLGSDESHLIDSEYEYLLNRASAYSISTVSLPKGEKLSRVADIIGIPLVELQKLNRHLKYDFIPPYADEYDIYIPYIKLSEFKQKYKVQPMNNMYVAKTQKQKDNLAAISKQYGVNQKGIKDYDNLKANLLSLKQSLTVSTTNKNRQNRKSYVVKAGDTLRSISTAFRVSVTDIKKINKLNSDKLQIGDVLSLQ